MERKLLVAIIVPIILGCVLIVLLIYDKSNSPGEVHRSDVVGEEQTGSSTAGSGEVASTPTVTPAALPTIVPTEVPTPMLTHTPTPIPTQTPTPAIQASAEATPTGKPSDGTADQNPDENTGGQGTEAPADSAYKVLHKQEGGDYTLVTDSVTKCFLIISNNDNTIRQTEFTYAQKYEDLSDYYTGPVFCYKNGRFIFIAQNHVVASDGVKETILHTFGEESLKNGIHVNPLLESENRILIGAASEGMLLVVDCGTLEVEKYFAHYNAEFLVFTDKYLCFSEKRRIPAGPYYNYIYVANAGKALLLASIGDIEKYTLENNLINIISCGNTFEINLETNELSSSKVIGKERTLYFPVYSDSIIYNLSEMRFIDHNEEGRPVQSIQLPDSWEGECYFTTWLNMEIFSFYEKGKTRIGPLLPPQNGVFAIVDHSEYPLENSRFLLHSKVIQQLDSGVTLIGEGEIFLLERIETINNDSALFEIVYAWIPIKEESRAYQMYIYVPHGEDKAPYINLVKQLLQFKSTN